MSQSTDQLRSLYRELLDKQRQVPSHVRSEYVQTLDKITELVKRSMESSEEMDYECSRSRCC